MRRASSCVHGSWSLLVKTRAKCCVRRPSNGGGRDHDAADQGRYEDETSPALTHWAIQSKKLLSWEGDAGRRVGSAVLPT